MTEEYRAQETLGKQVESGPLWGLSQLCQLILRGSQVHAQLWSPPLSAGARFGVGKDLRVVLKKVRVSQPCVEDGLPAAFPLF